MVLLAMLVPMAVLLRELRARGPAGPAPRSRCRRPRRWCRAGDDRARCRCTSTGSTAATAILTTVLYPDGDRPIGPGPGRGRPGRARPAAPGRPGSTTSAGGAEILVPVSLGRQQRAAGRHPGDPGRRARAGPRTSGVCAPCWCLPGSAWPCWPARSAGRPARPLVRRPDPARWPRTPGASASDPSRAGAADGPPEVRELGSRAEPAGRPDRGAARAGARGASPTSPTGCARRSPRCGCGSTASPTPTTRPARRRPRRARGAWSTTWCARPGAPSARGWWPRSDGVAVLAERAAVLGAAGRGPGPRLHARRADVAGPVLVRAAERTWRRWSTYCSTTSSPTPGRDAGPRHAGRPPGGRAGADGGGRRARASRRASTSPAAAPAAPGSTGLGLSIVDKTATESGGGLVVGARQRAAARVVVELGPPAVTTAQRR